MSHKIIELAELYVGDCDFGCENCPLGKPITITAPNSPVRLPKGMTLCKVFDLINLNQED